MTPFAHMNWKFCLAVVAEMANKIYFVDSLKVTISEELQISMAQMKVLVPCISCKVQFLIDMLS